MIAASFPAAPVRKMADQPGPLVALCLALCVIAIGGAIFDDRLLQGVPVWVKPLKFSVSFVVYFATLGWVVNRLSAPVRNGWAVWVALVLAVLASVFEQGYIFAMAGRAEASHFNDSGVFFVAMYALMGLGAALLMVSVAVIGWAAYRDRQAAMGPGLRIGVGLGFALSVGLTLVIGFTLGGNGGHFVGVPAPGAATLPLFGWSATVGDLRPAHFFGLHAMQAGPLLGWVLDRRGVARPRFWVGLGLAFYSLFSLLLFVQALAGLPLTDLAVFGL